jgi:ribosome recycling factor
MNRLFYGRYHLKRTIFIGSSRYHCISYQFFTSLPYELTFASLSPLPCKQLLVQAFHSSSTRFAGKNKKNSKAAGKEEVADVSLPNMKEIEQKMMSRISRLEEEYRTLRGGKASADMFSHIKVDISGSYASLSSCGQVTLQTPTRVNISVFDADIVNNVADAIRSAGMNLNPTIEGSHVVVNIPKTSKESKDMLLKTCSKIADKVTNHCDLTKTPKNFTALCMQTKQEIRQIRKDAMDSVKKIKSSISEDDSRKFTKDVSALQHFEVQYSLIL